MDGYESAARLFKEAIELPPNDREVYIHDAAHGDEALAQRVRRMISYVENQSPTQGLLGDGAAANSKQSNLHARVLGALIGNYRVEALIGEGGFGEVYQAEQERPVRRTVAMKILKATSVGGGGLDSQRIVSRFEAERQALAMMEHPGIARVIDAGQTDAALGSRPYVVMELVPGAPITDYCDSRTANLKSRLELFALVCQAVQHAHQRGIIHRDLKPSNILVAEIDGSSVPKIIDFGIAKAVQQSPARSAVVTRRMEVLGTPQYMSPEQADADERAIDTRTDVYSLGVVLYELLTGTTPLDPQTLRNATYSRMFEMLLDQRIERPSTRLLRLGVDAREKALRRATDAHTLCRRLRGELDWIVMKAVDPDRERRYGSASALADDLQRYLRLEPVQAGPPGAAYRVRKFVRRHRLGVTAATMTGAAIIGGAIIATVAMLNARRSADESRQVNQFMHDVLTSVDPDVHGADVRLAQVLGEASVTASTRFAEHPELEGQVREMLGKIFLRLALFAESGSEFYKAHRIWTSLGGPDDTRALQAQLHYVRVLGNQSRYRESEKILADLAPRIERVLGPDHAMSLEVQRAVGIAQTLLGRPELGEQTLRNALARAQRSGIDQTVGSLLDSLVQNLLHQSRMVESDRLAAIRAEVEVLSRELLEQSERIMGPASLQAIRARVALAQALCHRGNFLAAADLCGPILDTSADRLGECHSTRCDARTILSWARYRLGDATEAAQLQLDVVQCHRAAAVNPVLLLAAIYEALPFLEQGQRWSEGEALAREASDMLKSYGGGHGGMLLGADAHLARFISLQGRIEEADAMFESVLKRMPEIEDDSGFVARIKLLHAGHLMQRGQLEAARQRLDEVVELEGDPRNGTMDTTVDDIITQYIELYRAWGKPAEVERYQRMREEALRMPMK